MNSHATVNHLTEYWLINNFIDKILYLYCIIVYLLTWILGVASKQLRVLHGRVGDSTTVVNSLSPQMRELVEDAIAS